MVIIPKPQELSFFDGINELKGKLVISKSNYQKVKKDIEFFELDVEEAGTSKENIFFYESVNFKEEEYELLVDSAGIKIISASEQGRFRALASLKQILSQQKNGGVQYLRIHDYPDIPIRGIMLFVKSNCIYSMETLCYIIDRMAELKYNMLQLYFDTFVFEYDSFRKHLDGKVYYTKEEIYFIDKYCKERHIELMANVETFGHLTEFLDCEEFKHLGIPLPTRKPFTLNPLLDESFDVVKRLFDDLLPHFTSSTVNIGMDEPHGLGQHKTEDYCETFGVDRLFVEFLTKVSRYAKEKHGKKSMFWGDMAAKHPDCLKDIPDDVVYVDWGYEPGHNFDRNAIACKNAGLDFYVSPGTHNWGTISGRTDVMVQNIFSAAEAGRYYGATGFLLTDWTKTVTPSNSLLTYAFGGAFSWNSGYAKTFSEADNEANCCFRYEVINDVLKYCDMFIYNSGEKSCAELIYRMGNYWYLEQPASAATWNGTILSKYFFENDDIYPPLTYDQLKRIHNYMSEIREEFEDVLLNGKNEELIRNELKTVCDTILFAAEVLMKKFYKKFDYPEIDSDSLVERYKLLHKMHSRLSGEAAIIERIRKWKTGA